MAALIASAEAKMKNCFTFGSPFGGFGNRTVVG
jgi:hypothetical protein